ncbi:MAG TPA: trypsin-like peptidase domain-containing protein [Candidatus Paceibacterota bacterium]|nr:trypsin-like peptidase domain-containing protein [Candidatus Paceibacterota bacterium]
MSPRSLRLLSIVALVSLTIGAISLSQAYPLAFSAPAHAPALSSATSTPASATTSSQALDVSAKSATTTKATSTVAVRATSKSARKPQPISAPATSQTATAAEGVDQIVRIANPYSFPAESPELANSTARAAVVNILCISQGPIHSISGSGVIIDPRGIILTNAHVGQYVMLAQNPDMHISCTIRTGSPAQAAWTASTLYLPPIWVSQHIAQFNTSSETETGDHDYAFLLIDGSATGQSLPSTFPSLPVDTRNGVALTDDEVLIASYPAEFIGGMQVQNNLFAATSVATIGDVLSFTHGTVDLLQLPNVIEAQGGSSGGAVMNPWGHVVGIVTTTSEGATTADRSLYALTLFYISSDLAAQSGNSLASVLNGDLKAEQTSFDTSILPSLLGEYVSQLQNPQQ